MKDIVPRIVSGSAYVTLLTGSMMHYPTLFWIVILCFSTIVLYEFSELIQFSFLPYYFLLPAIGLAYAYSLLNPFLFDGILGFAILANLWVCRLCIRQRNSPFSVVEKHALTLFYLLGSSLFIPLLLEYPSEDGYQYLLSLYLALWVNNSFAYLVGSRWGKRKLFPAISPKKSHEGYWGGTLATVIAVYFIEQQWALFGNLWLLVGLVVPLLATMGDFVESYFKRRAQVKDSGTLLPGHGGFYDRMDSIIFTAPFYYLLLKFI